MRRRKANVVTHKYNQCASSLFTGQFLMFRSPCHNSFATIWGFFFFTSWSVDWNDSHECGRLMFSPIHFLRTNCAWFSISLVADEVGHFKTNKTKIHGGIMEKTQTRCLHCSRKKQKKMCVFCFFFPKKKSVFKFRHSWKIVHTRRDGV